MSPKLLLPVSLLMCWQHWGQIDAAPQPSSCVLTHLLCENVSLASFTKCCAPVSICMSHLGDVGQVHQPHCPQMNCQSKMEKHIRPLSEKWGKKWWKWKFRHFARRIQTKVYMEEDYGGEGKLCFLACLKSAMIVLLIKLLVRSGPTLLEGDKMTW